MATRGKFIVLEGGEGSGKGTISAHLKALLLGRDVLFTREPGGTPLGERIRDILLQEKMATMTELLLFEAGRAEHMHQVITPALARGTHVICDRFDASTYAYQVYARWSKKHADLFTTLNSDVLGDTIPDLYIFCDVLPEVALKRRMSAGGEITRFDKEELEFHNAVYFGYKEFLKDKPHAMIDASRPITDMTRAAENIILSLLEFSV
jgi:dTMP kinase